MQTNFWNYCICLLLEQLGREYIHFNSTQSCLVILYWEFCSVSVLHSPEKAILQKIPSGKGTELIMQLIVGKGGTSHLLWPLGLQPHKILKNVLKIYSVYEMDPKKLNGKLYLFIMFLNFLQSYP